jgi:hypothetical protein
MDLDLNLYCMFFKITCSLYTPRKDYIDPGDRNAIRGEYSTQPQFDELIRTNIKMIQHDGVHEDVSERRSISDHPK